MSVFADLTLRNLLGGFKEIFDQYNSGVVDYQVF